VSLTPQLERLARDCDITAYRSSGPGGQKKSTTESSARVRHLFTFNAPAATESRSQTRNRERALERVWEELQRRRRKPKPRVASRPTRAAVERRLEQKRHAGEKKRSRGSASDD